MTLDEIRSEIITAVSSYAYGFWQQPDFISGESRVNYSAQIFSQHEIVNLVDCALSGKITAGKWTEEFERKMRAFFGSRDFILVNSGSAANLLMVAALCSKEVEGHLKDGDEVVTVALGFPTTLAPIVQHRLVPVFVDVSRETYNPDPGAIEAAIGPRTRAVFLPHPMGFPFDAEAVKAICERRGLWFIEDGADALGATLGGRLVGTFGAMSSLSHFPAHHTTGGEGGSVVVNSPKFPVVVRSIKDWGRSCFPAGTLINVAGAVKPIEEVKVNDRVLTHRGTYQRVRQIFERRYTGKLYTFKPAMRPPITVTAEHPFLIRRRNKIQWVKAADILLRDMFIESISTRDISADPLQWSYEIGMPRYSKTLTRKIVPDPDLMRLVGYWLAEGSLAKALKGVSGYRANRYYCHRVDFAFHEKEEIYINDVRELMLKYFGIKGQIRRQSTSRGITLNFKTRMGYEFFKQLFSVGAAEKRLPAQMTDWPLVLTLDLVKGFWRGDGSSSFQGYVMHSVSVILMEQLRRILLKAGIVCSSWRREVDKHVSAVINGQPIIATRALNALSIYGVNAGAFAARISDGVYKPRSKNRHGKISHNGKRAFYRIGKISVEDVIDLPVFNLEVNRAHTYHAGGVIVHNCFCAPGVSNTCGQRFGWEWPLLPKAWDHKYTYTNVGFNLKATDMQAAILCAQADKIDFIVRRRRENYRRLYENLAPLDAFFSLPEVHPAADPSPYAFPLLVKPESGVTRDEVVRKLEAAKIETRPIFAGNLLRQPAFQHIERRIVGSLDNTDRIMRDGFFVGVHPYLGEAEIEYVFKRLKDVVAS